MLNKAAIFLLCVLPIAYACSQLVQPGIHVNYRSCSLDPYMYILSFREWNYLGPVGETALATIDARDGTLKKYPATDYIALCDEPTEPVAHNYSISANCTRDGLMWIISNNGAKIGQFAFEFLHEDNFFYEALLFFYDPVTDNFVIQFGSSHMDAINVLVSRETFEIVSRVKAERIPSTAWCRSYTLRDGICFAQNDCEQFANNLTTVKYYSDANILTIVNGFNYFCEIPYSSYVYDPSTGRTRPIEGVFGHTTYRKVGNMHQAIRKLDGNAVEVYTWPPFTVHQYNISDQQARDILGLNTNKTAKTGLIIGCVFGLLLVLISIFFVVYHFTHKKEDNVDNSKKEVELLETTRSSEDVALD